MADSAGVTILLVDDDDAVRRLCRIILEMQGYVVLEAESGSAALDAVAGRDESIAALVTDVAMPEMTGIQLADQLRRRLPTIPVVLMSGFTASAVIDEGALDAGYAFLQKPFAPTDLLHRLQSLLASEPPAG